MSMCTGIKFVQSCSGGVCVQATRDRCTVSHVYAHRMCVCDVRFVLAFRDTCTISIARICAVGCSDMYWRVVCTVSLDGCSRLNVGSR